MATAMELATAVAGVVAKHCTDVVMSPGSRNSPLAYALLARRDITVHMRIDERSAAFTAPVSYTHLTLPTSDLV